MATAISSTDQGLSAGLSGVSRLSEVHEFRHITNDLCRKVKAAPFAWIGRFFRLELVRVATPDAE
jgi:hypothetical protein